MTQLSEHATYQTRDGSRKGIRVKCNAEIDHPAQWISSLGTSHYPNGLVQFGRECPMDLIEEASSTLPPFSYDACPTGPDGRKRAVTRDGREVVLLANDMPGKFPIVGWYEAAHMRTGEWSAEGYSPSRPRDALTDYLDLLIPPPPKRIVWVNLYADGHAAHWPSKDMADARRDKLPTSFRLGNRAYPIEIDEATV